MSTSLLSFARVTTVACFTLVGSAQFSEANDAVQPSLLDALDQDFDAYVETIDAESLRRLPREDALYLLSQAFDLIELEADYHAEVIADYTFDGQAKDLAFFVQVAASTSYDFIEAYCAKVSLRLSESTLSADCLSEMAQVFVAQYGRGLPRAEYSPAVLDALYRISEADDLVRAGTFGDMSTTRVIRYLQLNEQANPDDYLAALANGGLCTSYVSDIDALAMVRPLCRVLEPTDEMLDEAKQFRLLNAVVEVCDGQPSFRQCFLNLIAHYEINRACIEPAHISPIKGWFNSKFFRTCLAGYMKDR